MATISEINSLLGTTRNEVYDKMADILKNAEMKAGDKSAALLEAQATLGLTDGVQNIVSKGYNRWSQTGQ